MAKRYRDKTTKEDISGAFKRDVVKFDGAAVNDTISFPKGFLESATKAQLISIGIESYEHVEPVPEPYVPTADELLDDEYPPLQKYQFDAMVDYLGLDAAIDNVINSMPDGIEKSLTKSLRKNGVDGYFRRSSQLFASIAANPDVPIDDDGINAAWSTAGSL